MARVSLAKWGGEIANGIGGAGLALLRGPASITVGFFWVMFSAWLFINANAWFGERFAAGVQASIVAYILLTLLFVAGLKLDNPLNSMSFWTFLRFYAPVFIIGSAIAASFFYFTGFQPPRLPTGTTTNSVIAFVTFIIAVPEELIFRHWLPLALMGKAKGATVGAPPTTHPFAAQIVSSIAFSMFHWVAYGGDVTALVFAFFAGLVFALFREGLDFQGTLQNRTGGLTMAIGVHAMYNAAVFGAYSIGGWPF